MGVITTTTVLDSLRYPSESMIDRRKSDGSLYFLKRTSSTQLDVFWSTDNGSTWSDLGASITRANLQETSGIFIDANSNLHLVYRVYESGQDRIYYRRRKPGASWEAERLVIGATAASAGAHYSGCSVLAFRLSNVDYIFYAVGTRNGTNSGVTLFSATINSSDTWAIKSTLINGYRQWLNGPDGVVHPAFDFKHTGDGKSVGSGPALWVAWGRSTVYCVKLSWQTGPTWSGPWTPTTVATPGGSRDHSVGRYNGYGDKFNVAFPVGSTVTIVERKVDDSSGTSRVTPAHPQGIVRYSALSNSATSNSYRVYAVGTTINDLYYIDYNAAAGTWGSWTLVSATDIVGTVPNNFSVRRNNYGNGQYDLTIAGGSSPYTITHTSSTSATAPQTPVITSPANGSAADVASTLTLAWTFTDDDPLDSQAAYAIKRVIGASTTYWNNASSTWQASETFNTSSTTSKVFSSGWGSDSDDAHFYSVKVRDQAALDSGYSNSVMVIASAKDNPTLTSPGASVVTPNVTATWTVSTQTAYRVVLKQSSITVYDSVWVDSTATSVIVPYTLVNAGSYTLELTTRNDEGLTSNTVSQAFTVTFTSPAAAILAFTPLSEQGIIKIDISNPQPTGIEPTPLNNTLYRREVGDTSEGIIVATGLNISTLPTNLLSADAATSESALGWAVNGNATPARTNVVALDGSWSTSFTAIALGDASIVLTPSYPIPVVEGQTFNASVWIRAATVSRTTQLRLFFRNASNVGVGAFTLQAAADSTSGWTQLSGSATAPATAVKATLAVYALSAAASEVHYIDRAHMSLSTDVAVPTTHDDFTVASQVDYEYRVKTVATTGAIAYSSWAT